MSGRPQQGIRELPVLHAHLLSEHIRRTMATYEGEDAWQKAVMMKLMLEFNDVGVELAGGF